MMFAKRIDLRCVRACMYVLLLLPHTERGWWHLWVIFFGGICRISWRVACFFFCIASERTPLLFLICLFVVDEVGGRGNVRNMFEL